MAKKPEKHIKTITEKYEIEGFYEDGSILYTDDDGDHIINLTDKLNENFGGETIKVSVSVKSEEDLMED